MRKISKCLSVRKALLVAVISCVIFTGCEKSSDKHVDLYEYMGFMDYAEQGTDENGTVQSQEGKRPAENQAVVVTEGEVSTYRAVVRDDKPYIDMEAVQEYIDKRFYRDVQEGIVLYTDANNVYKSYIGESECYLDGTAERLNYVVSFVEKDVCYVCMEFVERFADVDYTFYEGNDEIPARLCIAFKSGEYTVSAAKKDNEMRTSPDLMSDIVTEVKKEDKVTVLEQEEEWYKVQTEDGLIGFVREKYFKDNISKKIVERKNDYDTYLHNTSEEKIKLVWHQVTNEMKNADLNSLTKGMRGINVISPTWIKLKDNKGGIVELSSSEYVRQAHEQDLSVWVLADDFESNNKGNRYVNTVLAYTSRREKLEDNLIHSVIQCGADGINIDFEYISQENGQNYLQFLREMSIKCKKNNIVLSTDNYAPSAWSEYYDLNEQGRLADYVIVMSYDEHNASSKEAGAVASLPFVQKSVQDTVSRVGDASRVIMGVPFYTRVWEETPEEYAPEGSNIIEDSVNGNYALDSVAVSMERARELYQEAGAEPAWNEETGTNYVYYEEGNSVYQIWLEDAESIQRKLEVAAENELGGCACWKLGLEDKNIWNIIKNY